jgi:hypothetical protein
MLLGETWLHDIQVLCFFGELERKHGNTCEPADGLPHAFLPLCGFFASCRAKKQALAFLNESAALREGLGLIESQPEIKFCYLFLFLFLFLFALSPS